MHSEPRPMHSESKQEKKAFSARPALVAALCVLGYDAACGAYFLRTRDALVVGLAWNMLLAAAPLLLAHGALRCKARAAKAALWALWLLFLPNTFYLVTDLVHVPSPLEWQQGAAVLHDMRLAAWALLAIIGVGVLMGWLLGLETLLLFWRAARRALGAVRAFLCVAAVCALCGCGIYLGRFLRLNSWDVLHPAAFLRRLAETDLAFAAKIALLFAAAIFLVFCLFCALRPAPARDP